MLDIFDILGPVMVGPSSSHTAGAVRIGRMARTLLGEAPVRAKIGLYLTEDSSTSLTITKVALSNSSCG